MGNSGWEGVDRSGWSERREVIAPGDAKESSNGSILGRSEQSKDKKEDVRALAGGVWARVERPRISKSETTGGNGE